MRKASEVFPLQFRILFRQFLLRVIDLESLSVQADIPRFLGQFASILVLISLTGALGLLMSNSALFADPEKYVKFAWTAEQALISGTMLVVGLVVVVSWDSTFPDRRDVMVLCPLPVSPRMILFAKLSATAALLGLTIVTLNFATGIAWPLFIGAHHESAWGYLQSPAAYWLTIAAASGFCSVPCSAFKDSRRCCFHEACFWQSQHSRKSQRSAFCLADISFSPRSRQLQR